MLKIGFIGAGKVGLAFGIYLKQNNMDVYGYYSRTFNHAKKAAEMVEGKAERSLSDLVKHCDILFITTGDNQISTVCTQLINVQACKEKVVAHMSGALSSDILRQLQEKGNYIYSLHPLQSFADAKKSVSDLKSTYFTLEGNADKIHLLEDMLTKTGNPYFKLNAQQKSIYHAGACVVSNYLVTLIEYGLSLYASIGIEKNEAVKALFPLIQGTVNNVSELGTGKALTGPIARGDSTTIATHIQALKNETPDQLDLYCMLGLKTVDLAKQKIVEKDKEKIIEVEKILKECSN